MTVDEGGVVVLAIETILEMVLVHNLTNKRRGTGMPSGAEPDHSWPLANPNIEHYYYRLGMHSRWDRLSWVERCRRVGRRRNEILLGDPWFVETLANYVHCNLRRVPF